MAKHKMIGLGNTLIHSAALVGETVKSQGKRNEYKEGERSWGNDRPYHGTGKEETGLLAMEYNLGILSKILNPQETVIQSEVSQKEKNKSRALTHIYGI